MFFRRFLLLWLMIIPLCGAPAQAQAVTITRIASDLNNPRGVTVLPDGRLLVVEAGLGADEPGAAQGSGQISLFEDVNGDGTFDNPGERSPLLTGMPSYNSLKSILTGHDEVFGLAGIARLDDGRVFFTKDDPFAFPSRNRGEEGYYGDVGIFELLPDGGISALVNRTATLNALVYDPGRARFYVTESGFNRIMSLTLDGEVEIVGEFGLLAHHQQAVPAGIALDTRSGHLLVALFSGFVHNYYGTSISFMPGDAKIVRLDPDSGVVSDAITGLTTAIDVAADLAGNIFVAELTTAWPTALMPYEFDLRDPSAPPDPGGYARYSGRVSLYPADGSPPVILADALDTPTNLTYHDGRLYVSAGLGTPGRAIHTPHGIRRIEGVLYLIEGF
jgi:DNA-binding beta-propeller fold protein YncE